jgi:hypothetical protein
VTVSPSATPSISLDSITDTCPYGVNGLTQAENLEIGIRACSDGTNWHAILSQLTGNYSIQWRLLTNYPDYPPQQEVTGPGGNTGLFTFCDQVSELNEPNGLGFCPGVWYILEAVHVHEQAHEEHLLPALQTVAPQIQNELQGLSVPDSGQSEQQAIDEIEASPEFASVGMDAVNRWVLEFVPLAEADHTSGEAARRVHAFVEPMINSICEYATANSWTQQFPCEVCPTPTPTPTPPPPIANNATNVISSGFNANWTSVASATGYQLDVATNNSFTSYVTGYQNLDVGNVTSRSVSGLSRNTDYYYRLRAYNTGGTSGNSNVIHVKTKAH